MKIGYGYFPNSFYPAPPTRPIENPSPGYEAQLLRSAQHANILRDQIFQAQGTAPIL